MLDGVGGGQPEHGRPVALNGRDHAGERIRGDQRAHGVVDQDDRVLGAAKSGKGGGDTGLARIAALRDFDGNREGDGREQLPEAGLFGAPHGQHQAGEARSAGKGAQGKRNDRLAPKLQKLFGSPARAHARAEAGGRYDEEDLACV